MVVLAGGYTKRGEAVVLFINGDKSSECLISVPHARHDAYLRSLISFMRHKLK